MKKLTAILLAVLMVSFCFATTAMADETLDATADATVDATVDATADATVDATVDATSEDSSVDEGPELIDVSTGKTYTTTSNDDGATGGAPLYNGACDDGMGEGGYLTDGIVRDVEELTASGAGNMDKTVELAGTNRIHYVTLNIGATNNIGMVVLGTARRGNNRYTNIAGIEALVNGAWVAVNYTEEAVAIEGAEQYGSETIESYDQFYDIYAVFNNLVNASAIRVAIDTKDNTGLISHYGPRGYIAQLDEITVYSVVLPEGEVSDVVSGDNGGNGGSNNDTPITGDLGLGVFAVLAVVSLAGVVVAKKVK